MLGQLAARLPDELRDDPEVAAILAEGRTRRATVATIAYRGGLDEIGVLKPFDFSRATLDDRWAAGELAMQQAIAELGAGTHDQAGMLIVIDA